MTDLNEISQHILEVIYARMLHLKTTTASNSISSSFKSGGKPMDSQLTNMGGMNVLQNQIINVVRAYPGERGISVAQICDKLRGVSERQIRDDLDFLSAEGHVYSTVDDDHFRATEL
ncbi:unnamed protein product [Protopolystoma xenopodis]|uniref:Replication protein A C-terminal domain-containing protein n=1 Tax=Protopolystoma xenopodis TaxID=117903 RepID=A0A3S5B877_9PLAT|nr:unnamed protein product [Protopolystoma xenopodis]